MSDDIKACFSLLLFTRQTSSLFKCRLLFQFPVLRREQQAHFCFSRKQTAQNQNRDTSSTQASGRLVRVCVCATPAPATNVFIIHTFSAVNRLVWQWSRLSVYSWEVTKDGSSSIRKTKASSGVENELHTHSTCACLCVCRANYHLSKDNSGTSRWWYLRWFVIISNRWINPSF